MKSFRLEEMTGGWFVGNFFPAALRAEDFEVGVKKYRGGDQEDIHHHRIAVEITLIVSGEVVMFDETWGPGSIIVIEPGEATSFLCNQDAVTVVVKTPSVLGDKYSGDLETSGA